MAIYKCIAKVQNVKCIPPQPHRYLIEETCALLCACIPNDSLHYPQFIACTETSNFMHMDMVGLSRGAADCSETNFTIISLGGGGEFVHQPSENDSKEAPPSGR